MSLERLGLGLRQIAAGLALFLFAAALVAGSFSLAESERLLALPSPLPVSEMTPSLTAPAITLPPGTPSPEITSPPGVTSTPVPPTRTPGSLLFPSCAPPSGWGPYWVQPGDTILSLARRAGVTEDLLVEANCLEEAEVQPGLIIYLPGAFFITPTSVPCGAPPSWVLYTVQRGDTLFNLAQRLGTTVSAIKQANCMTTNAIYVGKPLYLPGLPPTFTPTYVPLPTFTPTPTATPTSFVTPTMTATPSPTLPTLPTGTPTPTATPTGVVTSTATPTFTPSPTFTPTPVLTETSTPTPSPVPSATPTSTPTSTPTATPTSTFTPTPTSTP